MRTVRGKIYEKVNDKWEKVEVIGLFHLWGSAYEQFESGPGNYTTAIIELPGGRIVTSSPEDVHFLD